MPDESSPSRHLRGDLFLYPVSSHEPSTHRCLPYFVGTACQRGPACHRNTVRQGRKRVTHRLANLGICTYFSCGSTLFLLLLRQLPLRFQLCLLFVPFSLLLLAFNGLDPLLVGLFVLLASFDKGVPKCDDFLPKLKLNGRGHALRA